MYMYIYICIKDTHTVARGQQGGPVVVGSGDGEVYCACRCARWRGGDVLFSLFMFSLVGLGCVCRCARWRDVQLSVVRFSKQV